jgi:hypothetical protein
MRLTAEAREQLASRRALKAGAGSPSPATPAAGAATPAAPGTPTSPGDVDHKGGPGNTQPGPKSEDGHRHGRGQGGKDGHDDHDHDQENVHDEHEHDDEKPSEGFVCGLLARALRFLPEATAARAAARRRALEALPRARRVRQVLLRRCLVMSHASWPFAALALYATVLFAYSLGVAYQAKASVALALALAAVRGVTAAPSAATRQLATEGLAFSTWLAPAGTAQRPSLAPACNSSGLSASLIRIGAQMRGLEVAVKYATSGLWTVDAAAAWPAEAWPRPTFSAASSSALAGAALGSDLSRGVSLGQVNGAGSGDVAPELPQNNAEAPALLRLLFQGICDFVSADRGTQSALAGQGGGSAALGLPPLDCTATAGGLLPSAQSVSTGAFRGLGDNGLVGALLFHGVRSRDALSLQNAAASAAAATRAAAGASFNASQFGLAADGAALPCPAPDLGFGSTFFNLDAETWQLLDPSARAGLGTVLFSVQQQLALLLTVQALLALFAIALAGLLYALALSPLLRDLDAQSKMTRAVFLLLPRRVLTAKGEGRDALMRALAEQRE